MWALIVAVTDALGQRRTTTVHLRAGRIVIQDSYTLDSPVQLRYVYGEGSRLTLDAWEMRALAPTPDAAFLLVLEGAEARRREQEQWTTEQLQDHGTCQPLWGS